MVLAAIGDATVDAISMVFGVDLKDPDSIVSAIAQNATQDAESNLIEGIVSTLFSPQTIVCDLLMEDGPSAIAVGDTVYCFFQGGKSGQLYYYSYQAGTTSPDLQVPANVAAPGPPGSAVFNDQLYLFYEGPGNNGQLWYSVYDGTDWTSGVVPGVSMSQTPSATVFNGSLYVFYQSAANDGTVCYSVFDGSSWAAEVQPPIGGISDSPAAVTFTPAGSNQAQLYVFYRGGGNSGWLFQNVFDGSTWSANTQIPNTSISGSPAAAVFDGKIYVAHQGQSSNQQLWYNAFDGSSWAGDVQVSGAAMTGSPSLVVANDQIYVAYSWPEDDALGWGPLFHAGNQGGTVETVGTAASPSTAAFQPPGSGSPLPYVFYLTTGAEGALWYNVCLGPNDWDGPDQVPNLGITGSPTVALLNDQPYIFYGGTGQLWYSVFNGSDWSSAASVPGVTLSQSPCAVASGGQLYVFYQGAGENGQLWYTVFSGSSWSAGKQVTGVTMSESPSAAVFNGDVYVFYQGAGSNSGQLWYDVLSGSSWAGPAQVTGASLTGSPSAVVVVNPQTGDDELVVFYQGSGNSGALCYSTFDGTAWSAQGVVPNVTISASPLAVVFTGVLYVFYEGGGDNAGELWYCGLTQGGWSPQAQVTGISISGQPSGVVYQPPNYGAAPLFIFHAGASGSGQLFYCECSACTWDNGPIAGPGLSFGPSATVFNGQPYVFYQGPGQNGELSYSFQTVDQDGSLSGVWTGGTAPNATIVQSPSAIVGTLPGSSGTMIYIFYQQGGELWYSTYDGNAWTDQGAGGGLLSCSPSAVWFTPPGGSTPQPYVFYQGPNKNGYLCYSFFNGNSWASGTVPGGVMMSESPNAMVIDDVLYILYEGPGNDGKLYYIATTDLENWAEPVEVGALMISNSPSLLVFNGMLCCFSQGLGSVGGDSDLGDGALWFDVGNGSFWSFNTRLNNVSIQNSPSAALFNDLPYVFYQNNGQLFYSVYDGGWQPQAQLVPQGLSDSDSILSNSPSAVSFAPGRSSATYYVFYQNGGQLFYNASSDGNDWGAQVQLIPSGEDAGSSIASQSPSAVVFNDQLYVLYTNKGSLFYASSSDGNSWSAQAQIPGISNYQESTSPYAVVFQNQLFVFYNHAWVGNPTMNPLGCLNYVVFDGKNWSGPYTAGANGYKNDMYQSPAAAVFGGQLYAFFQSGSANGQVSYTVFDGSNWTQISNAGLVTGMSGPTGANLANLVTKTQSAFMDFYSDLAGDDE